MRAECGSLRSRRSQDAKFTAGVIAETHGFYTALKSGKRVNDKGLSLF